MKNRVADDRPALELPVVYDFLGDRKPAPCDHDVHDTVITPRIPPSAYIRGVEVGFSEDRTKFQVRIVWSQPR